MELKQYWRILWRRLWIVVTLALVVALAGAYSVMSNSDDGVSYVAYLRLAFSLPPDSKAGDNPNFDTRVNAFIATEYLVDDFSEVVKSRTFAEDVKAQLEDPDIDLGTIQAAEKTEKTHRILNLEITSSDKEHARLIAEAAVKVIEQKSNEYFQQLGTDQAIVRVIDPPSIHAQDSLSQNYQLEIGLRTALAVMAGLALVFLLHYLDDTLYDAEEAEQLLALPILGNIPPERRRLRLFGKGSR